MFEDRVKQLKSVSIQELIQVIFKNPVEVEELGHQDDLRNFVLRIDHKFILKIYGDKERWQNEVQNLLRMRQSDFKVPRLIDYGMVNHYNGWTLMNVLPGEVMSESYQQLSLKEREEFWSEMGALLAKFHMANKTMYRDIVYFDKKSDAKSPMSYWEFIMGKYNRNKKKIEKKQYYGQLEAYQRAFAEIERGFTETRLSEVPLFVMCNRDFCIRNILYDKEQKNYGLIDFEMGFYGQPEADFARVLLDLIKEEMTEHFFNGYFETNHLMHRDNKTIRVNLLLKIIEICSWAFERSPQYYARTFEILKMLDHNLFLDH